MTAPFDPTCDTLITGAHATRVSALATFSGGDTLALDVVGGRVSYSARQSPRVTATLDVVVPDPPPQAAATRAAPPSRSRGGACAW